MTPDQLAADLGISPKTLRAWLRRKFPRSLVEMNERWELSERQVEVAQLHFRSESPTRFTPRMQVAADTMFPRAERLVQGAFGLLPFGANVQANRGALATVPRPSVARRLRMVVSAPTGTNQHRWVPC